MSYTAYENTNLFIRSGNTGPFPDNTPHQVSGDGHGGMLVSQHLPAYAEMARRGQIFVGRSGAAAAIPIFSTMTNAPTLWNPSDSGKLFLLLDIEVSFSALGTYAITGLVLMWEENMGAAIGTGAPFPTFTNIAPTCTCLGNRKTAKGKFANATVTWTTQPAVLRGLGMGQNIQGTAANGEPYNGQFFDLQGKVTMAPGVAIAVGGQAVATSATYWTSITYAELPLVAGVDT